MTSTPLSAASTAARAVSSSRISPIRRTSGPARSTARCAWANVGLPAPFTATWSIAGERALDRILERHQDPLPAC